MGKLYKNYIKQKSPEKYRTFLLYDKGENYELIYLSI